MQFSELSDLSSRCFYLDLSNVDVTTPPTPMLLVC